MNDCANCGRSFTGRICPKCRKTRGPIPVAPARPATPTRPVGAPVPGPPTPRGAAPLPSPATGPHPSPTAPLNPARPAPVAPIPEAPTSSPIPAPPLPRAGGVVVTPAPRLVGPNWIEGRVVNVGTGAQEQPRFDWWRLGTVVLGVILLFPVAIPFLAFGAALRVMGSRFAPGGGGMLTFRLLEVLFRDPKPIAVYVHLVQCGPDTVQVRQEGEFLTGRLFAGHEVRLAGTFRGGTLFVERGMDLNTGVALVMASRPWRAIFLVLIALLGLPFLASLVLGAGLAASSGQ